jgi:hypothetical protein
MPRRKGAARLRAFNFDMSPKDLLPPVDPDQGNPPPDNGRSASFAEENGMYPNYNTSSTFVLSAAFGPRKRHDCSQKRAPILGAGGALRGSGPMLLGTEAPADLLLFETLRFQTLVLNEAACCGLIHFVLESPQTLSD